MGRSENFTSSKLIDSALILAIFAAITYIFEFYLYVGYYDRLGVSIDLFRQTIDFYQAGGFLTLIFFICIVSFFICSVIFILMMLLSNEKIRSWLNPPSSQNEESQIKVWEPWIRISASVFLIAILLGVLLSLTVGLGKHLAEDVYEGNCALIIVSYKEGDKIHSLEGCFVTASADNYLIMKLSKDKKVTHEALVIPKNNIVALEFENKKVNIKYDN